MHTDTYTSLSPPPVCYFNQRSRYFAVPPVLTHLISPSILQRLRSWLSVGLLYDVHSMCSFTYLSVEFSYLVLSRLEMLKVSVFFLGVLLPPPVSPVPRGLSRLKSLGSHLPQVLFCDFSVLCLRTTDCLILLLH